MERESPNDFKFGDFYWSFSEWRRGKHGSERVKAFLLLLPSLEQREKISLKMHSVESRFIIGPSTILFGGVHVRIFQPGNFTGREGVNTLLLARISSGDASVSQLKFPS